MGRTRHGNILVAVLIFITLSLAAAGGLYLWQLRPSQPATTPSPAAVTNGATNL